jgi:hypothetical protein
MINKATDKLLLKNKEIFCKQHQHKRKLEVDLSEWENCKGADIFLVDVCFTIPFDREDGAMEKLRRLCKFYEIPQDKYFEYFKLSTTKEFKVEIEKKQALKIDKLKSRVNGGTVQTTLQPNQRNPKTNNFAGLATIYNSK